MNAADTGSPMSPPGVVRATSRGRLLSAALLAFAIALLAFFQFFVLPFISASLQADPAPRTIANLKYLFVGFAALAILPAMAMIATGRKILRCGQCPVPNAWVWRDTRIKRGGDAIRIGWICIVSGSAACLACIALSAYIWTMFERIAPQHKPRPGVTVLQQKLASQP
jgi:hypothetical protein